jgi:DNA-binding CsgD family transcriptional regulator
MGEDWTGQIHRALHIATSHRFQEQAGRAYANIATIYGGNRLYDEAERYLVDGIAYCDEYDLRTFGTCLRAEQTSVLERTGHWDESVSLCEDLLRDGGASPINRIYPLIVLGTIRARRGEPGAWECLADAEACAEGTGEPQRIVPMRLARAEVYWLEGKTAEAAHEAELADGPSADCEAWDRGAVAAWLLRTASPPSPRGKLAEPYRYQVEGDWEKAAQLWAGLGCQYEAALAQYDAAEEAPLREALRIFTDLGATAAAQLTRQKMRLLGIRSIPAGPRTATRAHPLGLTRRECEVLDLICAGHTNAEIAAKLFISAKTVDHHVSAVLAKLDAPTRNVAASHAARLGLAGAAEI